ncbi:MAG: hypothetical protein IJA10_10975 [Lachnospiraceae bacterium]|nr:hypothetical protein [Lachnospiraceae bacterium]
MNKQRARDILKVHACCSFTTKENKLCMLCPWNNTGDCIDTRINEELIIEAMNTLKGIKPMETVKLSEIKITKVFKNTTPNSERMQKCREYYEENKKQERPILLDYKNILRDGYIQYLILKENGVEEATIMRKKKYKKIKEKKTTLSYKNRATTYIFGMHPNSDCTQEFCWRVPASWGTWADNVNNGDIVICQTKFGFSPVVVNRVETLDKPPVDIMIKRVAKREIRRNGMVIV